MLKLESVRHEESEEYWGMKNVLQKKVHRLILMLTSQLYLWWLINESNGLQIRRELVR